MDLDKLIKDKKKLEDATAKLNDMIDNLLEKRYSLVTEIEKITSDKIKPLKDEVSQIEVELEKIMTETNVTTLRSAHMTAS